LQPLICSAENIICIKIYGGERDVVNFAAIHLFSSLLPNNFKHLNSYKYPFTLNTQIF